MTADALIWKSATELRDLIAHGDLSPVDLVQACLDRIDALDARLRAFIFVDREGALAAAQAAEDAVRSGGRLGPLHGIPVACKDDIWVRGMPATAGSLIFSNFVPSRDGTVARRLREAGAIIIGKTNLPEFTSWPRSKSYVGGETLNPWDLTRIPGASSGGSAAAVAAGMVPLAIGTDGGGSVRMPASYCGLVGLLTTIGRVPDHGGFLCSPMSSAGPMARTVADAALLQQVIAGFDPNVPDSIGDDSPYLLSTLENGVDELNIAWSPDFGRIMVEPGIVAAAETAMVALVASGAKVTRITELIPHPWGDGAFMGGAVEAARSSGHPDLLTFEDLPISGFDEADIAVTTVDGSGYFKAPSVQALFRQWGALMTPPQHLMALHMNPAAPQATAAELRDVMDRIFSSSDVLCSPTTTIVAPLVPPGWASPYPDPYHGTYFTFIANATGRPAISVPCGLAAGMPAGLQIIGKPGDEATIFRVARAIEKTLPPLPRLSGIGGLGNR